MTFHRFVSCALLVAGCAHAPNAPIQESEAASTAPTTWADRRAVFAEKLRATGCDIDPALPLDRIVDALEQCMQTVAAGNGHEDDPFVRASIEQAIAAVRSTPREFGIGAVLVREGEVVARAHNSQLGAMRTDLHAEMTLMNLYEEENRAGRAELSYDRSLRLYSSTEPCPMCYTRIVIAGVEARYGAPSREDGMAHLREHLPPSWAAAARQVQVSPANSSPRLNAIAEALFYTYTRFEQFAHLD